MARIAYIDKRFQGKSLKLIADANSIIAEYQRKRFTLTLRQLYYQFVARDLIANKMSEYKRLGAVINDARLAGYIDWNAIEDRTRNIRKFYFDHVKEPTTVLQDYADSYELDPWQDQENYVEVWIEKDALIGVIERICNDKRVPYFACRGYTSQSEQWGAGQRFANKMREGKHVHVLHLGDHDPSGIDMTRDNDERLLMFIRKDTAAVRKGDFSIHRLALNMDQVEQYSPPPNPAKDTDIRFASYVEQFGNECWELDALQPEVISSLIGDKIEELYDNEAYEKTERQEEEEKEPIYDAIRILEDHKNAE